MNFKPAGYWFQQRGHIDSSLSRQAATTTGHMLSQIADSKLATADSLHNSLPLTSSAINRRHPSNISNHISEHDNRNTIQQYGEYFGRGYGKRLGLNKRLYNHDWIFVNESRPVHPDRGLTQHDYRGLPPLENAQTTASSLIARSHRKPDEHWMTSCYDNYGQNVEKIPNTLVYHDDCKRLPIHPWHY